MERIYLDYAATTPLDTQVKTAMEPFFGTRFGNPGSLHSFGQEASAAVFGARRSIAEAIGAAYEQIIFTGSATEANNLALRGAVRVARRSGRGRPQIIVSQIEHESILETARSLESDGVRVLYLPVSSEGFIDIEKLKANLSEQTILVSIIYAHNEIGSIQPIAEVSRIIRDFRNRRNMRAPAAVIKRGARARTRKEKGMPHAFGTTYPLLHTDAVQAFSFLPADVSLLGVDLMTLSAHKIYGPKGIGALYLKNQETVAPLVTGGGQESGLRSGTENVPAIVGFGEAVRMASRRRAKEDTYVSALSLRLFSGLKKIVPGASLNGPPLSSRRLPNNLHICLPGVRAGEFLIQLDRAGVSASAGPACSSRSAAPSPTLRAIGRSGNYERQSIRFTLGRPTTSREIDRVLGIIKNLRQ